MRDTLDPASATGRPQPRRLETWRTRWAMLSPLTREIVVILFVKAIVLAVLWFAFFREPVAPGMTMDTQRVESRLLAPPAEAQGQGTHARH
jgi:hypothetical protein